MKKLFVQLLLCVFSVIPAFSQENHFTDAYEETLRQQAMSAYPIEKWDSLRCAWYGECQSSIPMRTSNLQTCPLAKKMLGWHAIGTSSSSYVWQSLSDLSYFSYEVNKTTGAPVNTAVNNFATDATVTTAKANGVNVSLCVTLFNNTNEFSTFFGTPAAQSNLIATLVTMVNNAGAKGINIDFEGTGLNSTYLSPFVSFMARLSDSLHTVVPNSQLSIDLQGTYAGSSSMLTQLNPYVDIFILMGYDYYWSGQFYPGPIAPTYLFPPATGDPNGHGFVSNDLNTLLRYIVPSKVILAMPYYGRRWKVTNGCTLPGIGTAATISTQTYTQFRQNTSGYYNTTLREPYTFNAWHCFTDVNGVANQQFMDDTISFKYKYDLIKQRSLAGGAVWRLGYDAGYPELWNMINDRLSTCATTPCSDTLYDMGGPLGNYVNNTNYTFTIAPPGAGYLVLRFFEFNLEQGYDSLRIYNGSSTAAPLLGSFTGASIPATLIANSGMLTIQFHSDGATVRSGYKALYSCYPGPYIARTVTSGNWASPQTWLHEVVPTMTDSAIVMPGHSVLVNASAQVGNVRISTGGSLSLANAAVNFTIGDGTSRSARVVNDGNVMMSAGKLLINGNFTSSASSTFDLSGGKMRIDGNSGDAATSVADGEHLFNIACAPEHFHFTGDTLQVVDPPLGSNSQAINCAINFGATSVLMFGDGVSTLLSNNTSGFGGNLLPAQIGKLVLHAATLGNNRIFKNENPLTVKTKCEILSGNLVQGAALTVDGN